MSDDRELLSKFVRDGSRSELSTLVERYRKMVYGVCLNELMDPDDAADATQATFILLQQSAAKIKRRERLSAWLYSAARHVCQNARRERQRRQRVEGTPLMDELATLAPSGIQGPDADHVMAHFHKLSENDRVALSLRYLNGMSVKEVGASLGIAEQAAQMRLVRAMDRFRSLLQRGGISLAMVDIDKLMSNQLPWDAPAVHLNPESQHRWATRMRPNRGRTLLRIGAYGFAGLAGFVIFAPMSIMMLGGLVPSNPVGAYQSWHIMSAAMTGADQTAIPVGSWSAEGELRGQKVKSDLSVFRSSNNEHYVVSVAETHGKSGKPSVHEGTSFNIDRYGDTWKLNGRNAESNGFSTFSWDKGDWSLLSNTDRSTERLSFHVNGSSITVIHEQGGSLRSLQVERSMVLTRTPGSPVTYLTP